MTGTLHVCTGCTHPDRGRREDARAGATLLVRLQALVAQAGLDPALKVAPYPCLGNCDRRCRASIGGSRRWSWLFGDLDPDRLPSEMAAFLRRWLAAPDGFLAKEDRPAGMRPHLIGRVPPAGRSGDRAETS
jgi:predicted metal-binding protein